MAGVITTQLTDHLNELVPQVKVDAVERKSALYNLFAKSTQAGGDSYNWRVNSAGNSSASSYAESEVEQVAGRQTQAKATLAWKGYRAIMRLTRFAMEDAGGSAYIVGDLVQSEVEGAFRDLLNDIEDGIYSDGTGNSSADITGLQAAIASTGTYAGIVRSGATYWQSHVTGSVGALAEADVQTTLLNLRGSTRKGMPTHILCNPTVFNILGNLLDANRRPVIAQSDGDALHFAGGFVTLSYEGLTVVQVPGYTAQRMDIIQLPNFAIKIIRDFTTDPFRNDNDDITAPMTWRGQLINHHSGQSGTLTGITS